LANPAHASSQVLGVYDEKLVEPMAKVLMQLNIKNAMVIHGQDGFDEASISAPTTVVEVHNGESYKYEITPEQFGLKRAQKSEVIGGTPDENAQITLDILNGQKGAKRDIILLNSALAIHTVKKEIDLESAIEMARKAIDDGSAINKLNEFVKLTEDSVAA